MERPFNLASYIEDNDDYENRHGVTFALLQNNAFWVCCCFPGIKEHNPYISLELVQEFISEEDLKSAIPFQCKEDLDIITPHYLLYLYGLGKMNVYCLVDGIYFGGTLCFFKRDTRLFAEEENSSEQHLVKNDLRTPEEFIDYTNKYFLITKIHLSPKKEVSNPDLYSPVSIHQLVRSPLLSISNS